MIAVIGAGAFGTALAVAEAAEGREVALWGRDAAAQAAAEAARASPRLPGVRLPDGLGCVSDLAALAGAEAVLLVLPAQATEPFLAAHGRRAARRAAGRSAPRASTRAACGCRPGSRPRTCPAGRWRR